MIKKTAKQPVCPYCGRIQPVMMDDVASDNIDWLKYINENHHDGEEYNFNCEHCGKPFKIDYSLTFTTEKTGG